MKIKAPKNTWARELSLIDWEKRNNAERISCEQRSCNNSNFNATVCRPEEIEEIYIYLTCRKCGTMMCLNDYYDIKRIKNA